MGRARMGKNRGQSASCPVQIVIQRNIFGRRSGQSPFFSQPFMAAKPATTNDENKGLTSSF